MMVAGWERGGGDTHLGVGVGEIAGEGGDGEGGHVLWEGGGRAREGEGEAPPRRASARRGGEGGLPMRRGAPRRICIMHVLMSVAGMPSRKCLSMHCLRSCSW